MFRQSSLCTRTVSLLAIAALISGCVPRTEPSIDQAQVDEFRSDPGAVVDFETAHGPITGYALPPFLAEAARYTGLSYAEVEALVSAAPALHSTPGQHSSMTPGAHVVTFVDPNGQGRSLGPGVFENTSSEPVALLIESRTVSGGLGNFNYVQLDPGDRFMLEHNEPVSTTTVIVVGGAIVLVVVVFEAGSRFVEGLFTCHLVPKSILPDYCTGTCPTGKACLASTTKGYGWGGTQAASCGCL